MTPRVSTAKPTSARGQVARIRRLKFGASDWGPARRSSWVFATNSDRVFSSSCCTWRARVSVRFWSMMACWCSRTTCWSRAERTASQASARLGRRMAARKIQTDRRMGSWEILAKNQKIRPLHHGGTEDAEVLRLSRPTLRKVREGWGTHRGAAMDPVSEDLSVVVDGGEDIGGVETQPWIGARGQEYLGIDSVIEIGERQRVGVPEHCQNLRAQEVVVTDGVERD